MDRHQLEIRKNITASGTNNPGYSRLQRAEQARRQLGNLYRIHPLKTVHLDIHVNPNHLERGEGGQIEPYNANISGLRSPLNNNALIEQIAQFDNVLVMSIPSFR